MQKKTRQSQSFTDKIPLRILWPCVLAITMLVHASYFNNGFTWLDHGDIEQGRTILPIAELHKAFSQPFGDTGFYRPLVTISHSLDFAIYGGRATGFHLTNVLLHTAVVASAALFVTVFFSLSRKEGLVAALIFGIHPLTWLPVGAISYRPELLAACFTLLAVYFHAKVRETKKWPFALASILCFLLALFSKETPLFWIPALIVAWEMIRFAGDKTPQLAKHKDSRKSTLFLLIGEMAMIGFYAALRTAAVPEIWHASSTSLSWSEAIATRLHVAGLRLIEVLSPLKPALSDATAIQCLLSQTSLAMLTTLIIAVVVVVRIGFCLPVSRILIFTAIALLPAMNIVPLPRFSTPHYGYFAAVAFGVAAVRLLKYGKTRPFPLQRTAQIAIGIWVWVAGFTTCTHGSRFQNDRTLFEPEVARDENFLEGHFYLGDSFMKRGDLQRAASAYNAALAADPNILAYVDRSSAMINYAGVLLKQGKQDEAQKMLKQVSGNVSASEQQLVDYNLALIANRRRDFARVAVLLEKHRIDWQRPEPLFMLANALRQLERTHEAVEVLKLALPYLDAKQRAKVMALIEASK